VDHSQVVLRYWKFMAIAVGIVYPTGDALEYLRSYLKKLAYVERRFTTSLLTPDYKGLCLPPTVRNERRKCNYVSTVWIACYTPDQHQTVNTHQAPWKLCLWRYVLGVSRSTTLASSSLCLLYRKQAPFTLAFTFSTVNSERCCLIDERPLTMSLVLG
jgi:hypothetical protein